MWLNGESRSLEIPRSWRCGGIADVEKSAWLVKACGWTWWVKFLGNRGADWNFWWFDCGVLFYCEGGFLDYFWALSVLIEQATESIFVSYWFEDTERRRMELVKLMMICYRNRSWTGKLFSPISSYSPILSLIFHNRWLTPELYLRRPPAAHPQYRLDRLLKKKAEEGVRIYVHVYKEVEGSMTMSSIHTKVSLGVGYIDFWGFS